MYINKYLSQGTNVVNSQQRIQYIIGPPGVPSTEAIDFSTGTGKESWSSNPFVLSYLDTMRVHYLLASSEGEMGKEKKVIQQIRITERKERNLQIHQKTESSEQAPCSSQHYLLPRTCRHREIGRANRFCRWLG